MKAPFRLVEDDISHDTVNCLRQLLAMAESGELIGVALVAMMKRRNYLTHSAGETHRNPTFTRGMLRVLDDNLARQIAG